MDMDVAAEVLAGSILTGLSLIIFVSTVVVINNIIHRYWKPIQMFKFLEYPPSVPEESKITQSNDTITTIKNNN